MAMSRTLKLLVVILCFLFSCLVFPSSNAQQLNSMTVDDYYEQGLIYYAEGNWEEAISSFTQAIQLDPDDHDAHYRRGFAHCKLANAKEANVDFAHATVLHPQAICFNGVFRLSNGGMQPLANPFELEKQGRAFMGVEDWDAALRKLQQAARLFRARAEMSDYRRVLTTANQLAPQ
ncbi:tetratricopeptide repeat protein [Leptothoe sp. PORK10 BA2]|uniref:tetratricopeptide repeat protein n=1 Tax=Leptothoe sp. PORK10 BA2 TaxID=3110254 RepID=UPI002B20FDB2|nr:tetratricopeptide repeat protein [Leptothoe sp. PORK10 BA2]MEA5464769.1 tetratricopeptide repeat protein [Leptothoe sp. PORK10 BA2]